jgi:large subunit ribosomal protein L22
MSNQTIASDADVLERPRQHRENRKKNIGRKVADNQAQAVAKFIRVPPRKARLVMDAVRGKYAQEALAFLRFIPNRAAQYISKVLTSAVANAANNHGLNPENLKLVECRVDEGPRMKRVQPRAQGRAYRILKRMSHITVIVEEVEPRPRKPKKSTRRDQPSRRSQVAPVVSVTPPPVVEDVETTTPVAEEVAAEPETTTAPVETAEQPPTAAVTEAPQTANPATTDEIGAPLTSEATAPLTPSTDGEAGAETAPETANANDKTDEIGAPTE